MSLEQTPRPAVARYLETVSPGAGVEPLWGDASTRRFWRVRPHYGPTRVLMDYGAPFEAETDDVRLHRVFTSAGLRVAALVAVAPEAGCLLLEDLGDRSLEGVFRDPGADDPREVFERAVLLAAEIAVSGSAALARSERCYGPALDEERFRYEMDFYLEHYARGLCRRDRLPEAIRHSLHELARRAAATPRRVMCHRDYHSRNLLLLGDGSLALVDIQDARWGPDSYDLASLLRDAYLDIDEAWIAPALELYRSRLADPPPLDELRARFDVVAAQRMIKALGTFGYQLTVRGNSRYADAIPRTLARLRRLLPALDATLGALLLDEGLV